MLVADIFQDTDVTYPCSDYHLSRTKSSGTANKNSLQRLDVEEKNIRKTVNFSSTW